MPVKEKQKILFVVANDLTIRNFIDCNALDDLVKQYDVIFLYSDAVSKKPFNNGIVINFFKKQRPLLRKIDIFLWDLTYIKYLRKTEMLNRKEGLSWNFKISLLPRRIIKILLFFSLPVIYEIIMWVFDQLVLRIDKDTLAKIKKIKPIAVIIPGITFDSFGLAVIKATQWLKIRSIMLVAHWDYFSIKGFLRSHPDHVCVWGEQMRNRAISFHKIPNSKISILGAPQFQAYFDFQHRSQTSQKNDVNDISSVKNFLFAGVGIPYDELTPLHIIDEEIGKSLPKDIKIIYRPHPKQHPRKCEYAFNKNDFKNVILDPQWANAGNSKDQFASMSYYLNLLNNVHGVITPCSTMLVESALCGKPSLVITFSDTVHDWKFENVLDFDHIQSLKKFKWLLFCFRKDDLIEKFKEFLGIVKIPTNIVEKIKEDIKFIVYSDENTYANRLVNLIDGLVNEI